MNWNPMDEYERHRTLKAMVRYGGGFAEALSQAWMRADSINSASLGKAFPDLVVKYGPGSMFYDAELRREVAA